MVNNLFSRFGRGASVSMEISLFSFSIFLLEGLLCLSKLDSVVHGFLFKCMFSCTFLCNIYYSGHCLVSKLFIKSRNFLSSNEFLTSCTSSWWVGMLFGGNG